MNSRPITLAQMELRPPRRMLYPWLTPMHMHTQVPRPCTLLVLNLKGPKKKANEAHKYDF